MTVIKVEQDHIWIWIAIEPKDKEILSFHISREQNMFVAKEQFILDVVE